MHVNNTRMMRILGRVNNGSNMASKVDHLHVEHMTTQSGLRRVIGLVPILIGLALQGHMSIV